MNTEKVTATLVAGILMGVLNDSAELFGHDATKIAALTLTHIIAQDAHDNGTLDELLRLQGVAEEISGRVLKEVERREQK